LSEGKYNKYMNNGIFLGSVYATFVFDTAPLDEGIATANVSLDSLGATADRTAGQVAVGGGVIAGTAPEIASVGGAADTAAGGFDLFSGSIIKTLAPLVALVAGYEGIKTLLSGVNTNTNLWNSSQSQIINSLKNTTDAVGLTVEQMDALAESTSANVDATAAQNLAAENTLLNYKTIGQTVFPLAVGQIDNLATALANVSGKSVASAQNYTQAARQLGKALENPTAGMSAFSRVGVTFSAVQIAQIKALQTSGDLIGAQTLLLSDLADVVRGKASTAADTFLGKLGLITKEIETYLRPAVDGLQKALAAVGIVFMDVMLLFDKYKVLLVALGTVVFIVLAMAIWYVVASTIAWGIAMIPLIAAWIVFNAVMLIWIGIAVAVAVIAYEIITHWQDVKNWFDDFWTFMKSGWGRFITYFVAVVFPFYGIPLLIMENWNTIKDFFIDLWHDLENVFSGSLGVIFTVLNPFIGIPLEIITHWKTIVGFFETLFTDPMQAFRDFVNGLYDIWNGLVADAEHWPVDLWNEIVSGFYSLIDDIESLGTLICGWIDSGWQSSIKDAQNWVADLIYWIGEGLVDSGEALESIGRDVLGGIKTGYDDAVRNAPQWGRDLVQWIKDGMMDMANYDLSSFINWKNQAVSAYQSAFAFGSTMVNDIWQGIQAGYKDVIQWGTDLLNWISEGLTEGYHDVVQWGKDIISDIWQGIQAGLRTVVQWGRNIITTIGTGFTSTVSTVIAWGSRIITDVGSGLVTGYHNLITGGSNIIGNIVTGMKNAVVSIWNFIISIPSLIAGALTSSGHQIGSSTGQGVSSFWKDEKEMQKIGDDILKGIGFAILGIIIAVGLLAVTIGVAIINGIISGVNFAYTEFSKFLGAMGGDVISWIGDALSWLWQKGVDTIQGLWNGIKSIFEGAAGIVGWFWNVGNRVVSAIGDLSTTLIHAGEALIGGLGTGIKDGATGVYNDAKKVLSDIAKLFPFSPAKEGPFSGKGWTLYSGRSLVQGLADGIIGQKDTAVNAIDTVMSGMQGALGLGTIPTIASTNTLQNGSTGGTNANGGVNIHGDVNINTPADDSRVFKLLTRGTQLASMGGVGVGA